MKPFAEKFSAPKYLAPLAREIEKHSRALNNFKFIAGGVAHVSTSGIKCDAWGSGGGRGFNGDAYDRAGNLTENLNLDSDKPWIKYLLNTGAFTEETGPPSSPWGNAEVWRKKTDIHGSLYLQ
jgi:hypothetical protein